MPSLKLVIGNKNYSSWSMRPWLVLKQFELPFEEIQLSLDFDKGNEHLLAYSPTKKVPVLQHEELTVWDSLAIVEYLADLHPGVPLWPGDIAQRARVRAISSEMHAGFHSLRGQCPMNIRRAPKSIEVGDNAMSDVARIEDIWRDCLEASGGPFLFGPFTIADAMFAPVVNRFETYRLCKDDACLGYMQRIKDLPAWQEWERDARAESWVIEQSEL